MIALDLDNTIICYDEAFRAAASLLACLPAVGTPINKSSIKAAALAKGGNDLWTRLQGLVYGEQIGMATLYPGCADFVAASREEIVILSHKTQFPVLAQGAIFAKRLPPGLNRLRLRICHCISSILAKRKLPRLQI